MEGLYFILACFYFVVAAKGDPNSHSAEVTKKRGIDINVKFGEPTYRFFVYENAKPELVGTINATFHGSADDISYSIPIEKEGFKVEPDTGKIYTTKSLDHEETPRIKLFLKATVGTASLYGLCLVTVIVMDVNDNVPKFAVSQAEVDAMEDIQSWFTIYKAHATDKDGPRNGAVYYKVSGSASDTFQIHRSQGTVSRRYSSRLDYSKKSRYELTIVASDKGRPSLSSSMTLIINVIDKNDNWPTFVENFWFGFVTLSTDVNDTVVQLAATDDDAGENGRITFGLKNDSLWSHSFGVKPDSGVIYSKQTFDKWSEDEYNLTVTAQDHGLVPYSTHSHVTIYFCNIF